MVYCMSLFSWAFAPGTKPVDLSEARNITDLGDYLNLVQGLPGESGDDFVYRNTKTNMQRDDELCVAYYMNENGSTNYLLVREKTDASDGSHTN